LFNSKKNNILIENLLDGIIFLSLNLEILIINNQALKILKWEFNKIYEKNFLNYFNLKIRKTFLNKIEELIYKKNFLKPRNYKEVLILQKKSSKKIVLFIIKVALKKKKISGIILIVKNITKKISLQTQKTLFLINISHELRTPLFNIQSFIQTLENSLKLLKQEEILDFLNITNKEILRLNRLVNKTINISNFNSHEKKNFLSISLNAIFNDFIQIYNIRIKEKKIKIVKEIEKNLPLILGKKDLVLQVFDNLISNAIKFSKENSVIIFRAYCISNIKIKKIRLEIGDYGIGIKTSNQKNLFYKFSRFNSRTKNFYGNGLGLFITKKILQSQKSSIYFTTEENEGTIFFFDFNYNYTKDKLI
jgi:two-component system, OmpR family, sensor histidine kinase NblS